MQQPRRNRPQILIVTPEISSLAPGMGKHAETVSAKAGGMADVAASLATALFAADADVHVAVPHFRNLFHVDVQQFADGALREYKYESKLEDSRVHFAEDRLFYYRSSVYGQGEGDAMKLALAFQREVIYHILPSVKPDLIQCHDWTTGLIPPVARRLGIPCLFTVHNIHTCETTLAEIEESGIDAAEFWQNLYYTRYPRNYEETRSTNPLDLLASGIFGADFATTVSPTFLAEIVAGCHDVVPRHVRRELRNKMDTGYARGILNAPPPEFDPSRDSHLAARYDAAGHSQAKRENKRAFQRRAGLEIDERAPLFFWPSRLDPTQKGCELLSQILYDVVSAYRDDGLQIAFVADGPSQQWFHDIRSLHGLDGRVAVAGFREDLSHLGYAASDFVLMPSRFEPCGLSQMIGCLYGSLPVVHDTGGLHDSVTHLVARENRGNGFVFKPHNCHALRASIDQAMDFHGLPAALKEANTARIMREAERRFLHSTMVDEYVCLYEQMLERPLVGTARPVAGKPAGKASKPAGAGRQRRSRREAVPIGPRRDAAAIGSRVLRQALASPSPSPVAP